MKATLGIKSFGCSEEGGKDGVDASGVRGEIESAGGDGAGNVG